MLQALTSCSLTGKENTLSQFVSVAHFETGEMKLEIAS